MAAAAVRPAARTARGDTVQPRRTAWRQRPRPAVPAASAAAARPNAAAGGRWRLKAQGGWPGRPGRTGSIADGPASPAAMVAAMDRAVRARPARPARFPPDSATGLPASSAAGLPAPAAGPRRAACAWRCTAPATGPGRALRAWRAVAPAAWLIRGRALAPRYWTLASGSRDRVPRPWACARPFGGPPARGPRRRTAGPGGPARA